MFYIPGQYGRIKGMLPQMTGFNPGEIFNKGQSLFSHFTAVVCGSRGILSIIPVPPDLSAWNS
jgi:hypothetical protein